MICEVIETNNRHYTNCLERAYLRSMLKDEPVKADICNYNN
jgi:hypothetical protein